MNAYKSLVPADPAIRRSRLLALNGEKRLAGWTPLRLELDNEDGLTPDIYSCGAGNMLVQRKALDVVGDLSSYAELLPAYWDGGDGFIINITTLSPCLHEAATRWHHDDASGVRLMIESYVFEPSQAPSTLFFKIPQVPFQTFGRDLEDGSSCLPSLVREAGLSGLRFEPVWQGDRIE